MIDLAGNEGARTPDSTDTCPECNRRDWEFLFQARSFTVGRCRHCELVRTLGVDFLDVPITYPAFDQSVETRAVRLMRLLVAQLLRERAAIVTSALRGTTKTGPIGTKRILDIGCGNGGFARLMSTREYDVVGIEPFSLGAEVETPHLRLIRAPFEAARKQLGRFDAVTMWHVLEHVATPGALLASLHDVLQNDGLLILSVPNFESWQSRLFRASWFHLDPPRHVTHFTRRTLTSMLDQAGYVITHERTFHLEYGPVGWLQSAMNRVLRRQNFLFELVKDRGALAEVSMLSMATNLALSTVLASGLAAPSVLLEALSALAGSGSVLTFVAVRR